MTAAQMVPTPAALHHADSIAQRVRSYLHTLDEPVRADAVVDAIGREHARAVHAALSAMQRRREVLHSIDGAGFAQYAINRSYTAPRCKPLSVVRRAAPPATPPELPAQGQLPLRAAIERKALKLAALRRLASITAEDISALLLDVARDLEALP